MAILKDNNYKESQIELFYVISPSTFFHQKYAAWIAVDLHFKFGDKLPSFHVQSHGQEYFEVENFAKQLQSLAKDEIDSVYFEPREPDYEISIKHCGLGKYIKENLYEIWVVIDANGVKGGVYCGSGPAIYMYVTREELTQFAGKILTELYKIKRTLGIDFQ